MLFLAKIRYQRSEYMGSSKFIDTVQLVDASDEDEAIEKVHSHYENKGSDYSTYYSVIDVKIEETIR